MYGTWWLLSGDICEKQDAAYGGLHSRLVVAEGYLPYVTIDSDVRSCDICLLQGKNVSNWPFSIELQSYIRCVIRLCYVLLFGGYTYVKNTAKLSKIIFGLLKIIAKRLLIYPFFVQVQIERYIKLHNFAQYWTFCFLPFSISQK